jgi:uncharacterized protein (DUF697 family)
LLHQVTPASAVASLASPAARRLAYEMAVCVCEADDLLNDAERTFLADLRRELKLDGEAVASFQQETDALVQVPLVTPAPTAPSQSLGLTASAAGAEVDRMILNYAILNGALELLPESLATMAIVPLQMKMVYRVGKRYGFELDRRHITELLGAAGVGLSSQVVEGFARKLLGGLLGKAAGGMGRKVGQQVASSAMSFASTYALGQMAQRYYAGGRTLSGMQLKELFGSLTEQAKTLHGRYAGEIQQKARGINPAQLLNLVRGGQAGDPAP